MSFMKRLLDVRDAAFMAILQLFLVVVIFLNVIILVLYYFQTAMPAIPSSDPLNQTQAQIASLTASGTTMSTIVLIILAASIVMAGVGLLMTRRRGE